MKTLFLMPWLVALLAGLAAMPATNVFKICAWNAGTMALDPWRMTTAAAVRRVAQTIRSWVTGLFTRRLAFACLAVLLAILVAHLSAGHAGLLMAVTPIAAAGAQTTAQLQTRRVELLREADALRPNGQFADDAARTAFDGKMVEVEAVDVQLRALAGAPAPASASDAAAIDAARTAAIADERTRGTAIREAVTRATRMSATVTLDVEGMIRRGLTIEQARSEIFASLAAVSETQRENPHRVEFGDDARDKWQRGALNWLLVKSGQAPLVARAEKLDVSKIDPGEFRGYTLLDLARQVLERSGRSVRGLDKMTIVSEAFTLRAQTQSTSDFTTLLENLLNKVLQAQYAIVPDTWRAFCNVSSNTDFRAANRYRWGNFSVLDTLTETGEFKTKPLSDAEKATITLATKGNIVNISRQMIVNDDMNAFSRLPLMLGRAAALSIEVDVYALLAQNAGLGPTMADSLTLFHATHGNLTTGAALSAAAIDADRVAMASQKEPNSNDYIDLRPSVLVIAVGLGGQARVINQSQYDPDTLANKSQMKPNIVVGLFSQIVDSPRVTAISTTRRYLFADPSIAPVLEVAFLEGQTAPVLETMDGWKTDGSELRVRFDYGTAAVDYRGAVTNAGV